VKRILLALAGLVAACVLVSAALFYVRVWPWFASPGDRPELDARWREVEQWAAVPAASLGSEAVTFRDALRAANLRFDVAPYPAEDSSLPAIEVDGLAVDVRSVLDSLVAWHESGAALTRGCIREPERIDALHAMHLGRIAIASSTHADDPHFAAALRMAAELRANGTLLQGAVGASLAREAIATASKRGFAATRSIVQFRPAKSEAFAALAREYVCTQQWLEHEIHQARPPTSPIGNPERELLMVRTYHSDRLHLVEPVRDDPRGIVRLLPPVKKEDLPKSLLVRIVAMDERSSIGDWAEAIEAYDAFIAERAMTK
jgi:hypothetical protein